MEELKFVSLATTYQIDKSFDSERFIKMRLKICHDGENPNGSNFNVKDIQKAKSSISNSPILANTIVDEDNQSVDLGGHDFHLEKHKLKDGEFKIIYDELIVGVIPETNNYEVVECDGRYYAFADCYIFREYSNYFEDYIEENKQSKLSMEILVDKSNFNKSTNTYDIIDFRYKGITFLGKNYGTGMIGAEATSFSSHKTGLFDLLSNLKSEIERYQLSLKEIDINNFSKKEDEINLNEKLELMKQYEIETDSLDFDINEITLDELKTKIDEYQKSINTKTNDFSLNGQFMDELIEKLSSEKITSEWGEYSKYCFVDFDSETNEVYCWDRQDWKLYGFTYSVDGDVVDVDFACKKRKKFSIVDFIDNTDKDVSFQNVVKDVFDLIVESKDKVISELSSDFDTYKTDYSTPNTDVEELKSFKENVLKEQRLEDEKSIFEQFNKDLSGVEDFETLKANCKELTLDEISDKCFSILGKKTAKFSTNKGKSTPVRVPVVEEKHESTSPYGDVYEKYLNK